MPVTNYLPSSRLVQPGVCTSATRPSTPFIGQCIYQTDTNNLFVWNGTAWVIPNQTTQNPEGVEFLEAGSFSAVSSKSISKFSSTYRNYQLWINITGASASTRLQLMLRSGSTDENGNNYYGVAKGDAIGLGSTDNYVGSGVGYYPICGIYGSATSNCSARVEIFQPNESRTTNFTHQAYGLTSTGGNSIYYGGCQHALATAYDGITIFPATGTITGSYAIYGMRNT